MASVNSNVIVDWFILQDYELNGVDITKVNFTDNQECLDLIEKVVLILNVDNVLTSFWC